jgi:hypothetical protein
MPSRMGCSSLALTIAAVYLYAQQAIPRWFWIPLDKRDYRKVSSTARGQKASYQEADLSRLGRKLWVNPSLAESSRADRTVGGELVYTVKV